MGAQITSYSVYSESGISDVGYYAQPAGQINVDRDSGYTNTVPYTIDLTNFIGGYNLYDQYVITVACEGLYSVFNTSTGALSGRLAYAKIWTTHVSWNGSTWVLNGAANQYAYNQDATNFPAGTGNAGSARIIVSGTSLQLAFYNRVSALAWNGTSWSTTYVAYQLSMLGSTLNPISFTNSPLPNIPMAPIPLTPTPVPTPVPQPPPAPPPPGQPPGKIICTAMNNRYGFGSFRNHVWLAYAKEHLTPEHEKGYHALFGLLVTIAYKSGDGYFNKIVRASLEEIVTRRTKDIWQEKRGKKRDWRGRIYRMIFEPACYIVGKIKKVL